MIATLKVGDLVRVKNNNFGDMKEFVGKYGILIQQRNPEKPGNLVFFDTRTQFWLWLAELEKIS